MSQTSEEVEKPESIDFTQHEDQIKEYLTGKGILLKTQAEIDKEVGTAVGKNHGEWEQRLQKASGKQKPAASKGLEWVDSLFTQPEKPSTDPEKPSTVSEDVNKGKILTLERELADMKREREESKLKDSSRLITSSVKSALKSLNFDGENQAEVSESRQNVLELMSSRYEWKLDDDNELVPYEKGKDEALINTDTGNPFTVSELVNKKFAKFLKSEKPASSVSGTGTTKADLITQLPNGVIKAKSLDQIRQHLLEKGLILGEPEYKRIWEESLKASSLTF